MINSDNGTIKATGTMASMMADYAVLTEGLVKILSRDMSKQEAIEKLVYVVNMATIKGDN